MNTIQYHPIGSYLKLRDQNILQVHNVVFNATSEREEVTYYSTNYEDFSEDCVISEVSEEDYKRYLEDKNKKVIDKFKSIIQVFEDTVPKDSWDYTILQDKNVIHFYVKFTNIEIRNRENMSHIMPEMYFRFSFKIDIQTLDEIRMARSKLTYDEFKSRYYFSHGYCEDGSFGSLCWGTDKLANSVGNLKNNIEPLDNLRLILMDLYSYVSWENLDSSCYAYLHSLKSYTFIQDDDYSYKLNANQILRIIKQVDLSEFIKFDQTNYVFELEKNKNFLNKLNEVIPDEFKCYYTPEGTYFHRTSNEEVSKIPRTSMNFEFKGGEVFREVLPPAEIDLNQYRRYISPDNIDLIENYLINNLEEVLKQYAEAA